MTNVIVVAHERSGTHFLMNTLAANFGLQASPWFNFDLPDLNINYHRAGIVRHVLRELAGQRLPIVKAHHAAPFFPEGSLAGWRTLVIARHPSGVFPSLHALLAAYSWREGPETDTVEDLMRSVPYGRMTRFQWDPCRTMLERWERHVEGWHARAEAGREPILFLRYADLDRDFAATVGRIAAFLGRPAPGPDAERPSPGDNTVLGAETPGARPGWTDACARLAEPSAVVRAHWPRAPSGSPLRSGTGAGNRPGTATVATRS